jgi:epoxyqueuosine reductase
MLTSKIRELADSVGIDALGFADASVFTNYTLKDSIRKDPKLSLQDAKSIVVAGIYIGGLTLPIWTNPLYGRTSRLYLSGYFLDVIKPLESIKSFLIDQGYDALICDSSKNETSILPLKLAAVRAGIGWQGKHTLLISKKFGTFLALGGILTNAHLELNLKEEPNLCRKCNKCQRACPMSALERSSVLDKKKCLSCLLQKEYLSDEVQLIMENRIGDCEICQEVCPWNKKHIENPLQTKLTLSFKKHKWVKHSYLPDLINMSEEEYKNTFGQLNTDIPYTIFHRNVLTAMQQRKNNPELINNDCDKRE